MSGSASCVQAPRALLLAALLVMSSYSHVANGVRTTPNTSGSADAARLDVAKGIPLPAAASRASYGYTSGKATALHESEPEELMMTKERAATGSRLPDCTHACGPCSPCRRVMVSFKCAEASESCPIAYRCMCRGRFFHVPSI
ncbi:protein EPIDERMAL PATTERNING FACTOR 2-like [Phragmites australis]|uniref:protein EPIDERMAL PATTERNING FACTOR 2-like n=1 Tax=Phragmites australis TaxID=29695 RepID=UPI002D77D15C|nr:protein EPIDERMAL PATTERNING FACTOR 2-like [Phragmites australis]